MAQTPPLLPARPPPSSQFDFQQSTTLITSPVSPPTHNPQSLPDRLIAPNISQISSALETYRPSRQPVAGSHDRHAHLRPSHPPVINSILDSFDDERDSFTSDSARADDNLGHLSPTTPRRSIQRYSWDRAASPDSTTRSRRSRDHVRPSHGFDTLNEDRELEFSDTANAAFSPTIPYTRPASGLSHRTRSSISRFSFDFGRRRRSSSIASLGSDPAVWKEKDAATRNKLSAESWVRQGQVADEGLDGAESPSTMKTLRRMDSREALRYPAFDSSMRSNDVLDFGGKVLDQEQIIPKTPTTIPGSRGRLYLNDEPMFKIPSRSSSQVSDITRPLDLHDANLPVSLRKSARNSFISDSVPTRTSSLLRTDSPSSFKQKDGRRRRRRHREGSKKRGSVSYDAPVELQPSPELEDTIPDSTWADLGEDDSTVKRILQLRELRNQRLVEEETAPSIPIDDVISQHQTSQSRRAGEAPYYSTSQHSSATHQADASRIGTKPHVHPPDFSVGSAFSRGASARKERAPSHSERSYAPPFDKFDLHNDSSPSTPMSSKLGDAVSLSVLRSDKTPRTERRKSLVQAFRSSTDRGRMQDSRLTPDAKADNTPARAGLFRGRSMRRSTGPKSPPSTELTRKLSRARSASHNREGSSMEASRSTNGIDTIELAIQTYLGAPRLSNRIEHPQSGREICFSDVGDPEGAAVVVCVGMGLTRYVTAFFDELAATLGLRLITLDRPGVGGSQAYPPGDKSGPLNWPDDVLTVCRHLGISSFSLLAHSAGAIYALATALVLPHMVTGKVHLLAPWVPLSQLEVNSDPTAAPPPAGAIPRSQRILRALPASFLKAANSSFMTATSASLKPVSKRQLNASRPQPRRNQSPTQARPPNLVATNTALRRESIMLMDQTMPSTDLLNDLSTHVAAGRAPSRNGPNEDAAGSDNLAIPSNDLEKDLNWYFSSAALEAVDKEDRERQHQYMRELTLRTWELATRDSHPATDLLICLERNRDIGFRYTDVTRRTVITHGSEDKRVPMGNVKWLADQVNQRARLDSATSTSSSWDRRATHSREGWADHENATVGCELRILQGEGHGLMASASIMSDVLTEIAGYSANAFAGSMLKDTS